MLQYSQNQSSRSILALLRWLATLVVAAEEVVTEEAVEAVAVDVVEEVAIPAPTLLPWAAAVVGDCLIAF